MSNEESKKCTLVGTSLKKIPEDLFDLLSRHGYESIKVQNILRQFV